MGTDELEAVRTSLTSKPRPPGWSERRQEAADRMAAGTRLFEWQAIARTHRVGLSSWLFVISASAATGVLFAQLQPIAALVSVLERNGVPAHQALRSNERASASPTRLMDPVAERPPVAPRVVLLNPGTVKEEPNRAARRSQPKFKRTNVTTRMSQGPRLAVRLFAGNSVH
jgi:hypothetical protein